MFHFILFLLKSRVSLSIVPQFLHLRHDGSPQDLINGVQLDIFFSDHLLWLDFCLVVDRRTCSFLDHAKKFSWLQVYNFGDLPLFYQEVRVINVQMHAPEQSLHFTEVRSQPIDKEFANFILSYLAGY